MVKVYANEVGYTVESEELVDLILTTKLLKRQDEGVYIAALKKLSNKMREELGIKNLISLVILDESTVYVLVYNIIAGSDDVYKQGRDENGVYLIIGEEEVEDDCEYCYCPLLCEN